MSALLETRMFSNSIHLPENTTLPSGLLDPKIISPNQFSIAQNTNLYMYMYIHFVTIYSSKNNIANFFFVKISENVGSHLANWVSYFVMPNVLDYHCKFADQENRELIRTPEIWPDDELSSQTWSICGISEGLFHQNYSKYIDAQYVCHENATF